MTLVSKVVSDSGLAVPDCCPLHGYASLPEILSELGEALRPHVASGRRIESVAAAFVLWAAEHMRPRFSRGPMTWAFVLNAVGFREDQGLGRDLAERGLAWWGVLRWYSPDSADALRSIGRRVTHAALRSFCADNLIVGVERGIRLRVWLTD